MASGGAWLVRALFMLALCVLLKLPFSASTADAQTLQATATANVRDRLSRFIGTVTFREEQAGVRVTGTFRNLPAGLHGLHIHSVGQCLSPSFLSAGAIFNPNGKRHGLRNPAGPQAGDLPSLVVGADGTGAVDAIAAGAALSSGPMALLAGGGTALIVHAGDDDQVTDPEGNAGERIACGILLPSDAAAASATALPVPTVAVVQQAPVTQPNTPDRSANSSFPMLAGGLGIVLLATGFLLRRRAHSR